MLGHPKNDGIVRNRCILRYSNKPSIELNSIECNIALHILYGEEHPDKLAKAWDLLFDSIANSHGISLNPEDVVTFTGPAFREVNPEEYANNG